MVIYSISRVSADSPHSLFQSLSALDKACVGADGWSADSFRSEVSKPNGIVLAAFCGEQLAGLLSGYTALGEADITSVAVAPEFRRQGIARELIAQFAQLLPNNTEGIFLEARESNSSARALYEKCGFEKLSIRRRFYSDPEEDAVVMIKKLKG